MKYLLDTNIFLRAAIGDELIQYKECVKLLQKVKDGTIEAITSTVVFAEMVWVLTRFYKLPKPEVVRAVTAVEYLSGLKIVDTYDNSVALAYYKQHNVKYIDCLLASICSSQPTNWTVVSYDTEFDVLGIVRKEPSEVMKLISKL